MKKRAVAALLSAAVVSLAGCAAVVAPSGTTSPVRSVVSRQRAGELPRADVLFATGSGDVLAVNVGTGKRIVIAKPPTDVGWTYQNPAISPSRRVVAVNTDNDVEILDARTGRRVEMVDPHGGYEPHWSPTGRLIAYGVGYDTYATDIFNRKSQKAYRFTSGQPVGWTPSGRAVLVLRDDGSKLALWKVPLGSGRPVKLIGPSPDPNSASYSPDGAWLAFGISDRLPAQQGDVDARCVIAIEQVRTGAIHRVTVEHRDQCDSSPTWSPSGTMLAFERDQWHPSTGKPSSRIMWVKIRNGHRAPNAHLHRLAEGSWPDW